MGQVRYVMAIRREGDRAQPLNGTDADLYSIIH